MPLDDIAKAKQVVPHGAIGIRLDDAVDGQQWKGAHDGNDDLDERARELVPLDDDAKAKQVVQLGDIGDGVDDAVDGQQRQGAHEPYDGDDDGA